MKKRTILFTVIALGVVSASVVGWRWFAAAEPQALVAQVLPRQPELESDQELLRARFEAATARARSRFGARQGLAELARLYHANGFLDQAVQCYGTLEQLEPSEPRWPHYHATILAGYGEIEPALARWRRVVELAPDYTPARLRVGDGELKANRFEAAAAVYSEVLQRTPDEPYAQLGLARIDFEQGRLEAAQRRLETLVHQTNYQLGYDLIVTLYERTGQAARAAAIRGMQKASGAYRDPDDPWLTELLEYCYDPYRLALEAGAIARNQDQATARRLLERAVELAPGDVAARFQLGTLCTAMGDVAAAKEHLERCTILAPTFSDAWARLSDLYAATGNKAAAERTLTAGLNHCPDSPGLHLMRARNLRDTGKVEPAMNHYLISARLRPNEPEAFAELGILLIGLGRVDEGMSRLQQAIETDPANPMILGILAMHAIETGNAAEADTWLARIAAQPRVPREHLNRLTTAYRKQFGRDISAAPR